MDIQAAFDQLYLIQDAVAIEIQRGKPGLHFFVAGQAAKQLGELGIFHLAIDVEVDLAQVKGDARGQPL